MSAVLYPTELHSRKLCAHYLVFYTTGQVYDIENLKYMNSFCAFNFHLTTFQQIFSQTEKNN